MKSSGSRFYLWVLGAIAAGAALGHFEPDLAVRLKPLGDGFIALIKMLIAPIIFLTVVLGIAGVSDVKKVGRVGVKAILYFEVVSTFALIIGLIVVNTLRPGAGFHADPATLDGAAVAKYATAAKEQSAAEFVLHIVPKTFTDAFTGNGDLLQVLLLAVLFGFALTHLGKRGSKVVELFETISHALLRHDGHRHEAGAHRRRCGNGLHDRQVRHRLARPAGQADGRLLPHLRAVRAGGAGAHRAPHRLRHPASFIRYIRDELLLVLGTSSSESALVPLMHKLEKLGCSRSRWSAWWCPAGYSFNLDGTNIYLTMAAMFIAQAHQHRPDPARRSSPCSPVAMLTSKGASGVTGAGFITLAATLARWCRRYRWRAWR